MASRKPRKSMSKCTPKAKKKNFAYPDTTKGSEIARRLREQANGLTESKRESLFEQGMQIIYGGPATEFNDGLILVETSLHSIPVLATSDCHLLNIDTMELRTVFDSRDLVAVTVAHQKLLLKAIKK